ncbi:predicted protein [Phaeodactylum tricornutum CCAP 1055/1]|jgi:homogentisate phytyltransferase/homogentisate geranylgeranyltransferase|uniref:Uncharacterized protein n=2 Tax=Phaeodactylum tricornutum TaxID=2850 RepID=B7G488_PHATC|nr:predicted protein [Phaeodactylum tricornutum CCAP 1055/1]EEC46573.1 predicted protein [Phaeodactylum tricornutum CCAP 1055/1]|eukprot:XP_002182033.1 predicted protein [Phaeodactylum tricornutum CCAP 1055/1]
MQVIRKMRLELSLLAALWTYLSVGLSSGYALPQPRALTAWTIGSSVVPELRSESYLQALSTIKDSERPNDRELKAATVSAADLSSKENPPFPIVLWRFSRPHTLIGSALAIPALHSLAAPSLQAAMSRINIQAMAYAMFPALLMNIYITGLNQITDVEIDKINKPFLPIAAGILSKKDGIATILLALFGSLWLGAANPVFSTQGLNVALWGSGILGTMYSLPPFRLKRFPLLAAFCIVAVRGAIINASFFAHAKAAAFGGSGVTVLNCLATDPRCYLSSIFFAVFGIVIALMKDVPDVAGDRNSNVRTFSVRLGQGRIFQASRRLLSGLFWTVGVGFGKAAFQAPTAGLAASRSLTAVAAFLGGCSVRKDAQGVDPENAGQVYSYYMHLWKLFYLSYLVLPFAR